MNDTPRTDSALGGYVATHPHLIGALEEMALLETELAAAKSENERLTRENVRFESDAYRGDDDEKRSLRAELAALREDKARLDWLDSHPTPESLHGTSDCRAIIDAARKTP